MRIIIRGLDDDEYSIIMSMKKALKCRNWRCFARKIGAVFEAYQQYRFRLLTPEEFISKIEEVFEGEYQEDNEADDIELV